MNLRDVLGIVRSRVRLILAITLVMAVGALVVSLLSPKSYMGEARVIVEEANLGITAFGAPTPGVSSELGRIQTHAQLISSRPFVVKVIEELKLNTTADDLISRLNVSQVGQTNVVVVDVTDSSPETATKIANALAQTYIDWSRAERRKSLAAAADEIGVGIDEALKQIAAAEATADAGHNSSSVQAELSAAQNRYAGLMDKQETVRISEQLETGSGTLVPGSVEDAVLVTANPVSNTAVALIVGLMVGVGFAFLLDSLHTTIKTREEATAAFDAPVLGVISRDRTRTSGDQGPTIVAAPGSLVASDYRLLAENIVLVTLRDRQTALLVTSASAGEGSPFVAANLAAALAQGGQRVVLIDADFRRDSGAVRYFEHEGDTGLAELLIGSHLPETLQKPEGAENLWVLPAGERPTSPAQLLRSDAMGEVIANLRQSVEWIIVDAPPLLVASDAAILATWCDATLMVVRTMTSERDDADRARERLDAVGATIVGTVMWNG